MDIVRFTWSRMFSVVLMAVLVQPMTAENASGQLQTFPDSSEDEGGSRPPGAPDPPPPGGCVEGPGPVKTAGSFVYDGGGATDINGDLHCFSSGDGGWETVTT